MKKNHSVIDFEFKLKVLRSFFGKEVMFSKVKESTVRTWLKDVNPNEETLKKFCESFGFELSDLLKSLEGGFAKVISEKTGKKLEDIIDIIKEIKTENSEEKKSWKKPINFFPLHALHENYGKGRLKNDFNQLKGIYAVYFYWTGSEEGLLYKFIINLESFDEESNIVKCTMTTDRAEYDGIVIILDDRIFWFMDCRPNTKSFPELFVLITTKTVRKLNYPLSCGIISGGSRSSTHNNEKSIPQSSRAVLKKLKTPNLKCIGALSVEELKSQEPNDYEKILKNIDNSVETPYNLLTCHNNIR